MHGPACIFRANLTPFSLKTKYGRAGLVVEEEEEEEEEDEQPKPEPKEEEAEDAMLKMIAEPFQAEEEGLDFEEFCEVRPRFGRIVALHRRSSISCQIHEDNRCLYTYF